LGPDFSDFQEVTTTNTNLPVEVSTSFPHNLIKNRKNDALAVYFPMALTTPAVPASIVTFFVISVDVTVVSWPIHPSSQVVL